MTGLRLAWLRARGRVEVRGRPRLARGVRIMVTRGARVVLEDRCELGEGCRIEAVAGTVRIGRGARLGERSVVVALAGVDVGAGCDMGDWVAITDAEPTYADPERPTRLQPLRAAPIRIGERARIGPHAAILAGATIAPGAEIAPYAVVGGGGRPAARYRVVGERAPRRSP
jgi:acetyltransferase-like isoleucine patch superfamily enzyme